MVSKTSSKTNVSKKDVVKNDVIKTDEVKTDEVKTDEVKTDKAKTDVATKKVSTMSVSTAMSKSVELISTSIIDEVVGNVDKESDMDDNTKKLLTGKLEEYKENLKASIKADNKKNKSSDKKERPAREQTNYNKYMAEQTAIYKKDKPELNNNDRFKTIAATWKSVKDTWKPSTV